MQTLFCARAQTSTSRFMATSALLDLIALQFDRRDAVEDRYCDLEAAARHRVDFLHGAMKARKRAAGNADLLAHLEGNGRLRPLDALLDLVQDAGRFRVRDRHRLVVGTKEA